MAAEALPRPCLIWSPQSTNLQILSGGLQPFVEASYRIFGTHPDDVWPKIMANREARLGKEFGEWFDQAGNLQPDLPRRKPATVIMLPKREVRIEDVAQTDSERRPKVSKGNLYQMPSRSPSVKHQPFADLACVAIEL